MEKDSINKKKTEYAIGVLETIQILLETQSEDLLKHNLDHIKKIIPLSIKELKENFTPHE
jgi:hypothetical protein